MYSYFRDFHEFVNTKCPHIQEFPQCMCTLKVSEIYFILCISLSVDFLSNFVSIFHFIKAFCYCTPVVQYAMLNYTWQHCVRCELPFVNLLIFNIIIKSIVDLFFRISQIVFQSLCPWTSCSKLDHVQNLGSW